MFGIKLDKETKKNEESKEVSVIHKTEECIEFTFQSKQQKKEYLAALKQEFKSQGIKEGEDEDRYQLLSDDDSELVVRVEVAPSILNKIEPFLSNKPIAETEDERTIKLTFQSREQKKGYMSSLKQRIKTNGLKAGEDADRYQLRSDDDSGLIVSIEASQGILDTIKPLLLVPVQNRSEKTHRNFSNQKIELKSFVQPSSLLQKETEISSHFLLQEIQKLYSLLQKGTTSITGIGRDAHVAKGGFLQITAARNLVELNYQKSDPQDIACTLILKMCTQLNNHNEDFYRLHGLNFYYQSSTVEEIPQDDLHEWIKNINIQEHKGILEVKDEENVGKTAELFLGVQKEAETKEDRGDVLLLLGEPGSGKSLFIWELIQETLKGFRTLLENAAQDEKENQGWEAWLKIYQKWLKEKGLTNTWLPVYIELKDYTLGDLKDILNKYLQKEIGLLGRDLPSFTHSVGKITPRILLILDGFDELKRAPNDKEIKDLFQHCLGDWSKERRPVKLLVTCRTRYFKNRAEETSVFKRTDGSDVHQHYMRRLLLPLREEQIYAYIKGYTDKKKRGAATVRGKSSLLEVEAYKSALRANVQLKDVARNPLVLWMFIEALPRLQKGIRESYIPSFHIYETFVAQWFERELSQVRKEYLNLSDISDEDKMLAHDFNQFAEHLAMSMFNQNTLNVRFDKSEEARECDLYMLSSESKLTSEMEDGIKATKRIAVQRRDKGNYCLFFLSKEKQQIERQSIDTKKYTPLIEALDKENFSGKQCSKKKLNIKKLVYEVITVYGGYIQDRIYDIWDSMFRRMISESEEEKSRDVEQRLMQFKSISPMRAIGGQHSFMHRSFYEYYIVARLLTLAEENELFEGVKTQMLEALNHRKIQEESQVLLFLAELSESLQEEDRRRLSILTRLLFEIVQDSKEKSIDIAQASANAMTLLNGIKFCFSGENLSGIRVPGADLSRGLLDHTDLSDANLRGVNFSNAFLRCTCFKGSDLREVFLESTRGDRVVTDQLQKKSMGAVLTPDHKRIFLIMQSGEVYVYDPIGHQVLQTLKFYRDSMISRVIVTPDNHLAFLYHQDGSEKVFIYDISSQKLLPPVSAAEGDLVSKIIVTLDSRLVFLYNADIDNDGGKQVLVYDVENTKLKFLTSLNASEGDLISEITLTPDNRMAFLYNDDFQNEGGHQVLVYDIAYRKSLAPLSASEGETISKVTVTSDNQLAFLYNQYNSGSRKILVYNIPKQKPLDLLKIARGRINSVTITPNSHLVFLYNRQLGNREVIVYNMSGTDLKLLTSLNVSEDQTISKVTVTLNSHLAFLYNDIPSSARKQKVLIYDLRHPDLKPLTPLNIAENEVISKITLTSDNRLAFLYNKASKGSQQVLVYNVASQKSMPPISIVEGETISKITVTSDSCLAFLYNWSRGSREVEVYDCKRKQLVSPLRFEEAIIGMHVCDPQDRKVFFSHYSCYIMNSLTEEIFLLCKMKERIKKVELLKNGDLWVTSKDSVYHAWNWCELGQIETTLRHSEKVFSARIKQIIKLTEKDYLSSSTYESHIWQVQGCKLLPVDRKERILTNVLFTPDGRLAFLYYHNGISIAGDGSHSCKGSQQVLAYDVSEPELKFVTVLSAAEGELTSITMSLDGRLVFLYDDWAGSRQVLVYNISSSELKHIASLSSGEIEVISKVIMTSDNRLAFFYNQGDPFFKKGGSQQVLVYDVSSSELKHIASLSSGKDEMISKITLTSDNRLAFFYNQYQGSQQVLVYDVSSSELKHIASLSSEKDEMISKITLTSDNRLAFFYNQYQGSRQVLVYDISSSELKHIASLSSEKDEMISKITLTSDNHLAFFYNHSTKESQQVLVYDISSSELKHIASLSSGKDEVISSVTVAADNRLAFLHSFHKGSQKILVYAVSSTKLMSLVPIDAPENEVISEIMLTSDKHIVLLGNHNKIFSYCYCEQHDKLVNLKPLNVQKMLELPVLENKKSVSLGSFNALQGLLFYGKGGCYLYLIKIDQVINLLQGTEIITAELFGNGIQLVTAGSDGTLRLWDISDRQRPLLKYCTYGVSFYARGAEYDEKTQLSSENRFILKRAALKHQEEENQEVKAVPASIADVLREKKRKLRGSAISHSSILAALEIKNQQIFTARKESKQQAAQNIQAFPSLVSVNSLTNQKNKYLGMEGTQASSAAFANSSRRQNTVTLQAPLLGRDSPLRTDVSSSSINPTSVSNIVSSSGSSPKRIRKKRDKLSKENSNKRKKGIASNVQCGRMTSEAAEHSDEPLQGGDLPRLGSRSDQEPA